MEYRNDDQNYEEQLASDIMDYVQDQLIVQLPYLNRAVLAMPVSYILDQMEISGNFQTDGDYIYCSPDSVITAFHEERNKLPHLVMHMVFHCLYLHPFHLGPINMTYWDYACDIAAETAVMSLEKDIFLLPDDEKRKAVIEQVRTLIADVSAEQIYHYLTHHPDEADELMLNASLFQMDAHDLWLNNEMYGGRRESAAKHVQDDIPSHKKKWEKVLSNVKSEMETEQRSYGEQSGQRKRYIQDLTRDSMDYGSFLKQFAKISEEIRLDLDTFDYIYYTYGLQLYHNLPLIEPLEYRDSMLIHDLVIAIDTSGSCQGEIVRHFLNKTYSILKNSQIFPRRMNLHIIQCDCRIQNDVKITSDEMFEEYMSHIEIIGYGGTNFCPVFEHVEDLLRQGEFEDLRGLLYFTDGYGKFPENAPSFKTAFILTKRDGVFAETPSWALAMPLNEEDLKDIML